MVLFFFERMMTMMKIIFITNAKKVTLRKTIPHEPVFFFPYGFRLRGEWPCPVGGTDPGTGEFHNFLNSFSHILLVAMHLAVGAEGLCLHKGAEVAALCGIGIQFRAFRTKGVTAVLLALVLLVYP